MIIVGIFLFFAVHLGGGFAQINLEDSFKDCHKTEETFDDCLKSTINDLRPFYKSGLPDYNISSFDPFFAPQIPQKRSGPFYNYKLILRNVTESGWTVSQITKLKSDLNKNFIQYTQFFPDKKLHGWYEIDGTFFGNKIMNSGAWNLSLYDFVQATTVTKKSIRQDDGNLITDSPLKVNVNIQTCKRLELHIDHLAGGRSRLENMLDWIINSAWQPGFVVLRPLINDLVSTAFTEIFNKNFQDFPFDKIIPN